MSNLSKTAIITGATGGLGEAIARTFAANGHNIVLSGRDENKLAQIAESLGDPNGVLAVAGDVSDAASRHALVSRALERFAGIDVLINNAGIFEPRPFLEVDEAYLDQFLNTNLKGTFFLSQSVVPVMQERGGGAIINIGTVLVDHALAGVPVTAPIVSKAAVHALTAQLAAEFGKDNIRVNTIAPGIIRSPIHARNGIEDVDSLAGLHLLGRIGEPDEIADAALMLATNEFITGTNLNVDGGHTAGHAIG